MMGQTDGRMDARPFHRPCCAYHADGVNITAAATRLARLKITLFVVRSYDNRAN